MNRSEYRRAFIMLRAAMPGYGGHVRLERRTLTGNMYFIVTAPQGTGALSAALVGQRHGEYYAVPIGSLMPDRRGQMTLAWQFDPRAIDGRPLEAYAWVAVARSSGGCAPVLVGNVEGSRPVDAQALAGAVCAALEPGGEPAADLPEGTSGETGQSGYETPSTAPGVEGEAAAELPGDAPGEMTPCGPETPSAAPGTEGEAAAQLPGDATGELRSCRPETPSSAEASVAHEAPESRVEAGAEAPEAPSPASLGEGTEAMQGDVKVYTRIRSRPRPARAREAVARDADNDRAAATGGADDAGRKAEELCGVAEHAPRQTEAGSAGATFVPATAAGRLGLDIVAPWPGAAEPLRRLFATQPALDTALGDGYTYVSAPMPEGCGYPACVIGLRVGESGIDGIRYALPGRYAPEAPAGMEGYAWRLTNGGEGYWVLDVNPAACAPGTGQNLQYHVATGAKN